MTTLYILLQICFSGCYRCCVLFHKSWYLNCHCQQFLTFVQNIMICNIVMCKLMQLQQNLLKCAGVETLFQIIMTLRGESATALRTIILGRKHMKKLLPFVISSGICSKESHKLNLPLFAVLYTWTKYLSNTTLEVPINIDLILIYVISCLLLRC